MQLSDNEKRDIIKFLKAGKSLPDKYRFLLFKDDREVELVWNGKTNPTLMTISKLAKALGVSADQLLK